MPLNRTLPELLIALVTGEALTRAEGLAVSLEVRSLRRQLAECAALKFPPAGAEIPS